MGSISEFGPVSDFLPGEQEALNDLGDGFRLDKNCPDPPVQPNKPTSDASYVFRNAESKINGSHANDYDRDYNVTESDA
ncbi:unnamed protein product [Trichobilharzia regenti]|nr:unnamed protein product [Trichobilharzia regenti]